MGYGWENIWQSAKNGFYCESVRSTMTQKQVFKKKKKNSIFCRGLGTIGDRIQIYDRNKNVKPTLNV